MACEICGRNWCARSFHSVDEQNDFDKDADKVKERMKEYLIREIGKLKDYAGGNSDRYLVDINEVESIINGY